ncbi:hypothetical protein VdG1_09414 [Verticillium dahliae VDG1]|nr:hypothetical protein VdG1_09414 [Verticillium dahliae VDG1]
MMGQLQRAADAGSHATMDRLQREAGEGRIPREQVTTALLGSLMGSGNSGKSCSGSPKVKKNAQAAAFQPRRGGGNGGNGGCLLIG